MAIRLGDDAPNFTADTTDGTIDFYDWKGDSWAVLFSHPADFTPVCTTELGRTAALKDEFDKRNVKAIAVSVDSVDNHKGWEPDIAEVTGSTVNFPLIADSDHKVSELYDMIHPGRGRLEHGPFGVHHRPEQQGAPDAHLPEVSRSQLRRDHPGHRRAAGHGQEPDLDSG